MQVTQCLGGLQPAPWYLAVAAPSGSAAAWPRPGDLRAFRVPHGAFVKLHAGTWHAGPLFAASPHMDFYNLVRLAKIVPATLRWSKKSQSGLKICCSFGCIWRRLCHPGGCLPGSQCLGPAGP